MNILHNIWLRIGKHYLNKKNLRQALVYFNKGHRAIQSFDDRLIYAELLHNMEQSEKALDVLGQVVDQSGSDRAYERRANILRELDREEEALADLNEAIAINNDSYMIWYTRGIVHKNMGRYEEAIRDLTEAIEREPESTVTSTYYELAAVYHANRDFAASVEYFERSISQPEKAIPYYYYMLSNALDLLDRVQEAVDVLQQGIQLLSTYEADPDGGYARFATSTSYGYGAFLSFQKLMEPTYSFRKDLAELYVQLKDYEQATQALTEALEMYPDTYELLIRRATIYREWGKAELAEGDFARAMELEPDNHQAYFELARLYRNDSDEDKALHAIEKIYAKQPDSALVCYWMADAYYRTQRLEEALQLNDKLLGLENDDYLNYMQRVDICLESFDLAEAERAVEEAIKLNDAVETRNKKSYILYLQGSNEDSLLELQKAAEHDPDFAEHPSYLISSGHILKAMGMWELAVDSYSQAIAIDPENPRLYEFRGDCFMETGQYDRAVKDCTQGLRIDPDYSLLYSMRSFAYFQLMDYDRAKGDVLKWMEYYPSDPSAYYRLGQIYYKDGDEQAALEAFDQVLEMNSSHAGSYLYKAHIYFNQYELDEAIQAIVNWSLNLGIEMTSADKIQAIESLEGFEEGVLNKAVSRLTEMYGQQLYLS